MDVRPHHNGLELCQTLREPRSRQTNSQSRRRSFPSSRSDGGREAGPQKAGELFLPILAEVGEGIGAETDATHDRLRALHGVIDRVGDSRRC